MSSKKTKKKQKQKPITFVDDARPVKLFEHYLSINSKDRDKTRFKNPFHFRVVVDPQIMAIRTQEKDGQLVKVRYNGDTDAGVHKKLDDVRYIEIRKLIVPTKFFDKSGAMYLTLKIKEIDDFQYLTTIPYIDDENARNDIIVNMYYDGPIGDGKFSQFININQQKKYCIKDKLKKLTISVCDECGKLLEINESKTEFNDLPFPDLNFDDKDPRFNCENPEYDPRAVPFPSYPDYVIIDNLEYDYYANIVHAIDPDDEGMPVDVGKTKYKLNKCKPEIHLFMVVGIDLEYVNPV